MHPGAILRVSAVPGYRSQLLLGFLAGGPQGCDRALYLGLVRCPGCRSQLLLGFFAGGPGMRPGAILRVSAVPGV